MTKRQHRMMRKRRKNSKVYKSHPHDSLFKQVFKRPKFCRALMQAATPHGCLLRRGCAPSSYPDPSGLHLPARRQTSLSVR